MKKLLLVLSALVPATVFAHEGHGFFNGHSLAHYLGSAEHSIPLVAIVALGVFFAFRNYKRTAQKSHK